MDEVNATIVRGRRSTKVHVNRLKPFFFLKKRGGGMVNSNAAYLFVADEVGNPHVGCLGVS